MLTLVIFILNYFNKRSTDGRDKYFSIQSKQAVRLQELIENIDSVKVGLYEDFFKTRLNGLRKKANDNLKTVHTSLGIVEFVLIMTPFIFSCTIVTTYNLFNTEEVRTTQIFTVISLMIAVSVPLRNFSESLRLYRMFLVAYKCTSTFFEFSEEKKKGICPVDKNGVLKGQIQMAGCSFTIGTGTSVKKINDAFESNGTTSKAASHQK